MPTIPNQCPYQASTSYTLRFLRYSPDKILKVKVTKARSKVKIRAHHDVAHLQPPTNVPTKYQLLHLTVSEIQPGQDFQIQGQTRFYRSRSLRQGQSSNQGHDAAHLQLPINVLTKYQLFTLHGFQDIAPTRFSISKSLQQGQMSNQGHTMMLYTYTP